MLHHEYDEYHLIQGLTCNQPQIPRNIFSVGETWSEDWWPQKQGVKKYEEHKRDSSTDAV